MRSRLRKRGTSWSRFHLDNTFAPWQLVRMTADQTFKLPISLANR